MGMRNGVHSRVREQLEHAALQFLIDAGPHSRQEIADRLGVSVNTVGPFLISALEAGVLQTGSATSRHAERPGKNPEVFAIDPEDGVLIGVDLGYDYARAVAARLDGELHPLHAEFGQELPEMGPYLGADIHDQPTDTLERVSSWIKELIEHTGHRPEQVAGIGIGIAAPVGPDRTSEDAQLRDARGMRAWRTVPIKTQLRQYLEWPNVPIHVDNDATLGLVAETRWGALRDEDAEDVLFVKWTTGIGMGLTLGGQVYRGAGNIAGEFGHAPITVNPDDRQLQISLEEVWPEAKEIEWPATCTRGCAEFCLESVAGRHAIVNDFRRRTRRPEPVELDEIMALARDGDVPAKDAIGQASRYLGEALVPLLNTLNPSRLVIGGTLGGPRNFSLYNDEITSAVRDHALMAVAADCRLLGGAISGATVRGAVAFAMEHEAIAYMHRRIRRDVPAQSR